MKSLQEAIKEKQVVGSGSRLVARQKVEDFFSKHKEEKMFEITNERADDLFPSCKGKATQVRYNYRKNFVVSYKGSNGDNDVGFKAGNLWAIIRVKRCDPKELQYLKDTNELVKPKTLGSKSADKTAKTATSATK